MGSEGKQIELLSYNGKVNWKTIFDDVAAQMGVAVSYSYNAEFVDVSDGFSFVGPAKDIISKGCACCGLSWSIQNGVLRIKRPDVMSREVYVLSAPTGLLGIPARVAIEKSSLDSGTSKKQLGWEVEYFLNGAINIDDYVRLESKSVTGYFRVHKVEPTTCLETGRARRSFWRWSNNDAGICSAGKRHGEVQPERGAYRDPRLYHFF